jgi:hypothetical protein
MDNDNRTSNGSQETETTTDSLKNLRDQAINTLLPLVDQLSEPPERKFEILMMATRTSNNLELMKKTLEIAQQLDSNDKKAEAVLDVLNEINLQIRDSA